MFQLFAMERYNGIMQGIHTDGRCPAVTMMRTTRQYQKMLNLTESNDLKFSDVERKVWYDLTNRSLGDNDLSPVSDIELDEW